MNNHTIAIYESKKSEKVVKFVRGVYMLMEFCSKRQAIKICTAAENGDLWGCYFTKSGALLIDRTFSTRKDANDTAKRLLKNPVKI